jgi:rSAM/selenodomain-associated transferase 1
LKGIIVFIKNPELGKVKTRLAISMGDNKALEIYNKLVGYTKQVLLQLSNTKKYVYYSSFVDRQDDWNNDHFEKRIQSPGGLGQRMTAAFGETFETCEQVLIIGSDCPQLTPFHINYAFERLSNHNVVIGPSQDGGYYLLGMDRHYLDLFQDIEWSTSTVFSDTIHKAKNNGLSISELEILSDIDYEEDWIKYGF